MFSMPRCILSILALFLIQTGCKTRHNLADRLSEMGYMDLSLSDNLGRNSTSLDSKRVQEGRHIDNYHER
ncbi:hypothetical protein FIBSPDRAFT_871263 [Athelia psychrophila]|uniref:Uncharacterized protein n=1 Tax=Athelia psychrophila TaxID=1759441 RepID=A0A166AFX8_9AGAM|nr:hypothetical protein FIBSPDRAFT_871263 [Fibularhizoctonia sp. CBS 109695]